LLILLKGFPLFNQGLSRNLKIWSVMQNPSNKFQHTFTWLDIQKVIAKKNKQKNPQLNKEFKSEVSLKN